MKERQFEDTLAASLELSFETSVAGEAPAGGGGRGGRGGRGAPAAAPAAPTPTPAEAALAAQQAGRGGRGGPTFTIAIPGQSFTVGATLFNQSPENLNVDAIEVIPADGKNWNVRAEGTPTHEAGAGKQVQWRFAVAVPQDAPFTRPYYTRPDEEQPYYDVVDARYRNAAARALSACGARAAFLSRRAIRNLASGAVERTHPRNRHGSESAAGGPRDFRDAIAISGRGADGIESLQLHLHRPQQRERRRARRVAIEVAARLAIDAARIAVLLRARWRGSDRRVLGRAGSS